MADDEHAPAGDDRRLRRRMSEHPIVVAAAGTVLAAAIVGGVTGAYHAWDVAAHPVRTCADPNARLLAGAELDATATSSHPPEGSLTYDAANLVDGRTDTAWVEGVDGPVAGQKVTVTMPTPVDVVLVCVMNGYASDPDHYQRNGRVRDYRTTTDAGSAASAMVTGNSGFQTYQQLAVVAGRTTRIAVTIVTVQAGAPTAKGRAFADTAVSELLVYVG